MSENLHKNVCDERIFASLFKRHSNDLRRFLHYQYGEELSPYDKMQEAFIKLYQNCESVTPQKARGFLYKVAKNLMLNEIKHQKVVLKYRETKPKDYTNESPEFVLQEKEFMKRYQMALERLPNDQRVAFLLNKVEGKKHAEIAEMLGVTRKAVENRIYSAYNKLKAELEGFK